MIGGKNVYEKNYKLELYNDHHQNNESREEWRDIPNYEGIYQASDKGRIRSLDRYVNNQRNNASKRLVIGRVLRSFLAGAGYEYVTLSVNQKKRNVLVHRLVISAFLGESCLTVHHKNEIKTDNRLLNLEYVTQLSNCNLGTRNKRISQRAKKRLARGDLVRNEKGQFTSNKKMIKRNDIFEYKM